MLKRFLFKSAKFFDYFSKHRKGIGYPDPCIVQCIYANGVHTGLLLVRLQ